MDTYNIWANKKDDITSKEFLDLMKKFLDRLVENNVMVQYRVTQRKLGFGPKFLGEYHIQMDFNDMAQLDAAMDVTIHNKSVDNAHVGFNKFAKDLNHALYRDV